MDDFLTVLVDNRAEEPFSKEHGFSLLIHWKGKRILFDTAQGDALFHNAAVMDIPLDNLDILVLSHGHYDHTGNVAAILEKNPQIKVYAHPDCQIERYSRQKDGDLHAASISEKDRKALADLPESRRFWCREPLEILPGFHISGSIPRLYEDEDTGGDFYTEKECINKDLIFDDMSVWLDTGEQISILCGCCHSGLRNTIDYILSLCGGKKIRTILGGYHLVHAGEKRISDTIKYLNRKSIGQVIPAHCTGKTAMSRFQEELSSKVTLSQTGLKVSIH